MLTNQRPNFRALPVLVNALQIASVGPSDRGGLFLVLENGETFFAGAEMIARMEPKPGDYVVCQSDGYIYLNPREVFERKYEAIGADVEHFSFGRAIEAVKAGCRVARAGWNGKGMWLGYTAADQWGLGSGQPYDHGKVGAKLLPWIGMKTADGAYVPWLASQTDVLADDWELAPHQVQTTRENSGARDARQGQTA